MIAVEHLSKFYSGKMAIDDISFSIDDGEIVGLLGLNGAGKSTILKILGCFLLPSHGRASIGGVSVEEDPQSVRRMIGFLPDSPPLYNEMTVKSYLTYVARIKEVPSADVPRSVDEAISRTNTGEVSDSAIATLSHGFRQRVGIAQAIVHNPRVLILDEPINGLDPVQIVEMRDLILSLRKKHTVILSSHILSEITKTCDRIIIIDRGGVVAEGKEGELRNSGSQNMTIVCEVVGDGAKYKSVVSAVSGVRSVQLKPSQNAHSVFEIQANLDVRSAVAKALVGAGAELLVLNHGGDALENLFLKFVKS